MRVPFQCAIHTNPNAPFFAVTLLIAGLLYAGTSEAAPVTFEFGGTVTSVNDVGNIPAPWDTVVVTDTWSITYTFESTTADTNPSLTFGNYDNAISNYTVVMGTQNHSGSPSFSDINIFNGQPVGVDQYEVSITDPLAPWFSLFFQLDDNTDSAWPTDALPLAGDIPQPVTSEFPTTRDISLQFDISFPDVIVGSIDFHNVVPNVVPEPSTLVLSALALLSLGFIGWRRRGR